MKKIYMFFFVVLILLTGCSKNEEEIVGLESKPNTSPLEVTINIEPNKVEQGENVNINALIIQGEEKINDATEVKFEVWKSGNDTHRMFIADRKGDGIYSVTKSFDDAGQYFIVAHVTARNMHAMPKKEITVGHTELEEEKNTKEEDHHHHHSDINITLNNNERFEVNKNIKLSTSIHNQDSLLSGAEVTFEVWSEKQEEQHEWIPTIEESTGKYIAEKKFENSGTYHVQIHVKKDDIHEHKLEMITVE